MKKKVIFDSIVITLKDEEEEEEENNFEEAHSPPVNIDEVTVLLNLHIESIAFQFNNKFLKLIQSEFSHSESYRVLDERRKNH